MGNRFLLVVCYDCSVEETAICEFLAASAACPLRHQSSPPPAAARERLLL